MGRAIILLLDSFGIGSSQDAVHYGDVGADTFGHIVEYFFQHQNTPLKIPHLTALGLPMAALASTGKLLPGIDKNIPLRGAYGYGVELSLGKDTPSGHWEMTGVPVFFDWGYFPRTIPCFPQKLIDALIDEAKLPGVLGNKHASGTEIINELGEEHIASGKPIVYTSADSVFQIAAHEDSFGLDSLYRVCEITRQLVDEYHIARVIARPFRGHTGNFSRTFNRKDYATPPHAPTLLDHLINAKREVISIGKVADIFAYRGISQKIKADGNTALFDATLAALKKAPEGSLLFTNFVDFDTNYGHRRDIFGYATALEAFDARLPELEALLKPDDIVIITADHGCDPSWPGSDHTREHIPILLFGPQVTPRFLGRRESFADIGQSIAKHLGLSPLDFGISFVP